MNPELPKPLQAALAKGAGGDAHPSLDVLTAFAEQTLTSDEKKSVNDHVSHCANCREVLFLASSAVEEPVGVEVDLETASSDRRFVADRVYGQVAARESPALAVLRASPPRRPRIPMIWAMAAVAGVAIISSLAVWRYSSMNLARQAGRTVASNVEVPAAVSPETKPTPNARPTKGGAYGATKPEQAKVVPSAKDRMLAYSTGATGSAEQQPPAPAVGGQVQPGSQPSAPTAMENLKIIAPAASPRTGFAPSAADNTTTETVDTLMAKTQIARGLAAAHGKWRISSDGHVEHLIGPTYWTRVPVNQDTRFRVISVLGNDVWTGGSGGALFHSHDGGQYWIRVTLSGEAASVVSIQFDDPQHGTVTTSEGTRWSTSDGGATWIKQ
jgi:hypothetical protein